VHNVITPNGDGKNDLWVIDNVDLYPNNTVQLFNKLGDKIFEQSHYRNDWDGGNIPSGMYYYVINLATQNRVTGKTSYTGYLMIKR
jgi:gliding motility-associated-like protein